MLSSNSQPQSSFLLDRTKTIGFREALKFTTARNPKLFTPDELALLLQAKDLRNNIEHYQFVFDAARVRMLCIDFIAICMLISQRLLSTNIVDAFSWDSISNKPDPVGDYLSSLMTEGSAIGNGATQKTASSWTSQNANEPVFLCLNCGARAVTRDRGVCMGCGVDGDEEIVTLLDEFETAVRALRELQSTDGSQRSDVKTPLM